MRCAKCDQDKPLDEFNGARGRTRWCESCRAKGRAYAARAYARHSARIRKNAKAWHARNPDAALSYRVRALYGLTLDEYRAIIARGCSICGTTEGVRVDHDHAGQNVRDGLCDRCNVGIGHFRDDPELLRAAAEYVERHRPAPITV